MEEVIPDAYDINLTSIFDEGSIIMAFSLGLRAFGDRRELVAEPLNKMVELGYGHAFSLLDDHQIIVGSSSKNKNIQILLETIGLHIFELYEKGLIGKAIRGEVEDYAYSMIPFIVKKRKFYLLQMADSVLDCGKVFGEFEEHNALENILRSFY